MKFLEETNERRVGIARPFESQTEQSCLARRLMAILMMPLTIGLLVEGELATSVGSYGVLALIGQ